MLLAKVSSERDKKSLPIFFVEIKPSANYILAPYPTGVNQAFGVVRGRRPVTETYVFSPLNKLLL